MGCGESKLAVATADGILRRKKSIANGSKSARKVADGSKSGADLKKIDDDVKVESEKKIDEEKIKSGADSAVADLKVASEEIDCGEKVESVKKMEQGEEKKRDEEKIDSAVKIESENKIENREEKKSDEVKIVDAVKIESEKIDGDVKIESEKKIVGAVNVVSENKTEHQEEKKSDGVVAEESVNGGAVEKQVAGETKSEKEEIDVKKEIKAAEEKKMAGEMKIEKEEGGVNGGGVVEQQEIKPVEENKLAAEPKAEKENGETEKMKEEVSAKKEIAAPKVEETQISATPAAQENSVKDIKENAADLPAKVSTGTEIAQ